MKRLFLGAVAMFTLTGCQVFTIGEWEVWPTEWDANSGDRIDVVMSPEGDWVERCNHMGGEPIQIGPNVLRCEGVDF